MVKIMYGVIGSVTLLAGVVGYYIIKKYKKEDKHAIYYDCAFIDNKGVRIYSENSTVETYIPIAPVNLLPGVMVFTNFLERSKSSIDLCFYGITSKSIINFIIDLKKKGRKVCLIIDNSGIKNEEIRRMRLAGVRIYTNWKTEHNSLMHHKFMIIDNSEVFITSMNPTTSAFCGNNENMIMTNDYLLVREYVKQFVTMKDKFILM